jgi:uncharacterized protein
VLSPSSWGTSSASSDGCSRAGTTTHKLVVRNNELTEAIDDHFIKTTTAYRTPDRRPR